MCWIPAGSFDMGSPDDEQDRNNDEGPVHQVTFTHGFWMGEYEVTQQQWEAVMGSNPSSGYGVGDNYPVYYVSWYDIQEFEYSLNDVFCLPSEAEWEYACRAGTTTRFYWGDDLNYSQIDRYEWFQGNGGLTNHIVGLKLPNDWGLYDMSGNVGEWCEDWSHNSYDGAPSDGSAWNIPVGTEKIKRGGSVQSGSAATSRSAYRGGDVTPEHRFYTSGFRLVRDP
jgi:formylglycine-generating enzyme required for sulfatase activity